MADIHIDFEHGAAKACNHCDGRIDEVELERQLLYLRELTAKDFYLCHNCITIKNGKCTRCNGAVYVPPHTTDKPTPEICPACRNDIIQNTGEDPGWYAL